VSRGQRNWSPQPYSQFSRQELLLFLPSSSQLYSRDWVDSVPDPLLIWKSGGAGNGTREPCICSQELWPLDHRAIWNSVKRKRKHTKCLKKHNPNLRQVQASRKRQDVSPRRRAFWSTFDRNHDGKCREARDALLEDWKRTCHDICDVVKLSYGTCPRVLLHDLSLGLTASKFVLKLLSNYTALPSALSSGSRP
jgi:hypothetical protein